MVLYLTGKIHIRETCKPHLVHVPIKLVYSTKYCENVVIVVSLKELKK